MPLKRRFTVFALCGLIMVSTGCATSMAICGRAKKPEISFFYAATVLDWELAGAPDVGPVAAILFALDIPFSVITDTLFLPFDLLRPWAWRRFMD